MHALKSKATVQHLAQSSARGGQYLLQGMGEKVGGVLAARAVRLSTQRCVSCLC